MTADHPNIFPAMRYHDAPAAIEWLGKAFGFEPKFIVPGSEGRVAHAQLRLGSGMIMLGSTMEGEEPPGADGKTSQVVYVCVADIDAHYQRAVDAGADVIRELATTEYGSREYDARDLEGYVWSFGTYDPYATPAS